MTNDQRQYLQVAFPEDDTIKCYLDDQGNPLTTLGPIADINFFIGANNSGKSRMLRWLCRNSGFRVLGEGERTQFLSQLQRLKQGEETIATTWPGGRATLTWDFTRVEGKPDREALVRDLGTETGTVTLAAEGPESLLVAVRKAWSLPAVTQDVSLHVRALRLLVKFVMRTHTPAHEARLAFRFTQANPANSDAIQSVDAALSSYEALCDLANRVLPKVPARRSYVPVLRSAFRMDPANPETVTHEEWEPTEDDTRDPLEPAGSHTVEGRLRRMYQLDAEDVTSTLWVETGQYLYADILRARNSDRATRDLFDAFVDFVGAVFFPDESVDIVAALGGSHRGRIVIKIGGKQERPLYDLGDGVQALLLLLYPIFMAPDDSWIFIDEPETHLHPGFQRLFLETLLSNKAIAEKRLKFFFTTHSNHFVDHSIEHNHRMRVFAFAEAPKADNGHQRFTVRNVVGPDRDVLRELGVRNGSVLLANCAIWVEGPTDRQYLRAFLDAYQADEARTFREDLHYAFFEYGGSLLGHYSFDDEDDSEESASLTAEQKKQIKAQFIANHVFLIADRDEAKWKRERHRDFAELSSGNSDFSFYVTEGREIENLLSEVELRAGASKWSPEPGLAKIKRDGPQGYKDKALGPYLQSRVAKTILKSKSKVLVSKRKTQLADALTLAQGDDPSFIRLDTMTTDARDLAEKLYRFIASHNQTQA